MKIKIKGVCVDINRPRTQEDLNRLLNVCKSEAKTASKARKAFIQMLIKVIDRKLRKENYSTIKTNAYEEKELKLA